MERDSVGPGRPIWQHAVFYSWLLLATVGPLVDEARSGRPLWPPLALIAALAGWYAFWLVLREAPAAGTPAVYLGGGGLLWLSLVAVDGSFVLVGLNVFAPYCLRSRRIGLSVVALCAGGWLWQRVDATGSVSWPEIVVAALIAVSGSAVVGYVSALSRVGAEQRRLIEQLEAAQTARAAAERAAGVAAERQRLARDIHDTLTQGFASIVMLLEAAEASASQGRPAGRQVSQALQAARDNLSESRRVVWDLRPGELGVGELAEALRGIAARLSDETGVRTDTVVTGSTRPLAAETQTALLRVAQEALANVRRHARAGRVDLTLSYAEDVVMLDIQDDGQGFDARRLGTHDGRLTGFGLQTMRERIVALGGTLAVESSPGDGTTVAVTLPVRPGEPAQASYDDPGVGAAVSDS